MIWLGEKRGFLADWVTQRWVQFTGRRVALAEVPWLGGPIGSSRGIGKDYFAELADRQGLELRREGDRGLLRDLGELAAPDFDATKVNQRVTDFYTRTSEYELDSGPNGVARSDRSVPFS